MLLQLVLLLGQDARFKTTAPLVLVPVSVKDKSGKTVDGLEESDFELYEDGHLRAHKMEFTVAPISVVVAIQSSVVSGPALAKIQKIGSMIQPLVAGEKGFAAVMTYSSQIKLRQDFTSDPGKIAAAFRSIEPDGFGGDMHEAVAESVRMLAARPKGSRRVLILIGEGKSRSGKIKLEEVITQAQAANVTIYALSYSAYLTAFTSKGAGQFKSGKPVYNPIGNNGLLAILMEIAKASNKNSHEALAKYTGGLQLSFLKLKGLEEVMAKAGEDLHTQYLLSFVPSPSEEPVYHSIDVRVRGHGDKAVRTRPGYWPAQ